MFCPVALCGEASGEDRIPTPRSVSLVRSVLIAVLVFVIAGCSGASKKLPVVYTFAGLKTGFINEDGHPVQFPDKYRGHLVVVSFIYTHCPDICPMTTNNMQKLQEKLSHDGINGVRFVTLTFDPNRDTPDVLRKYAEIRGISFRDWDFLTGTKSNIDSVLGRIRMKYIMVDSSYSDGHQLSYFINHSDECVLVDRAGAYAASIAEAGLISKA